MESSERQMKTSVFKGTKEYFQRAFFLLSVFFLLNMFHSDSLILSLYKYWAGMGEVIIFSTAVPSWDWDMRPQSTTGFISSWIKQSRPARLWCQMRPCSWVVGIWGLPISFYHLKYSHCSRLKREHRITVGRVPTRTSSPALCLKFLLAILL